jgi:UPF0042 nucleotide-binding protein
MNMNQKNKNILIVTGLAGAGMSSSLKFLEDLGYEVFDNFPLSLLSELIDDSKDTPIAVGVDSRSRGFNAKALQKAQEKHNAFLVFLTAEEAVLQKRFTETRRKHPQAKDRPPSAGIKVEEKLLYPLRAVANLILDTSTLSIHDLKRLVHGHFGSKTDKNLNVNLLSFGFKNGTPREADLVIDVRFLKNPYWNEELRALTGLDKEVTDFINSDSGLEPFFKKFKALILELLPRYNLEGKVYLTIAIGCTGGKHRSVYVTEKLKSEIIDFGYKAYIQHRDIKK